MERPDTEQLYTLIDQSWPAAEMVKTDAFTLRRGEGGGSRVSAATAKSADAVQHIKEAERQMLDWGQEKLFMIQPGDEALDAALEAEGYSIKDPVHLFLAPIANVARERPKSLSSFAVDAPLACQKKIWKDSGIGQERLNVMQRCSLKKTTLLGRRSETPAGATFVATSEKLAMLHALEVAPQFRRSGLGRDLTVSAAFWAEAKGAEWFALLVTRANEGAVALYSSLGMSIVGGYHYRIKK